MVAGWPASRIKGYGEIRPYFVATRTLTCRTDFEIANRSGLFAKSVVFKLALRRNSRFVNLALHSLERLPGFFSLKHCTVSNGTFEWSRLLFRFIYGTRMLWEQNDVDAHH